MAEDEAMRQIKFSIPGQPFGKQRPRVVHNGSYSRAYTPKETVSYENLVKVMYQQAAKGRMFSDGDMLDVRIIAYYAIPKSTSCHPSNYSRVVPSDYFTAVLPRYNLTFT